MDVSVGISNRNDCILLEAIIVYLALALQEGGMEGGDEREYKPARTKWILASLPSPSANDGPC